MRVYPKYWRLDMSLLPLGLGYTAATLGYPPFANNR